MQRKQLKTKKQSPLKLFAPPESRIDEPNDVSDVPSNAVLSNDDFIHYDFLGTPSDVQGQGPPNNIIPCECRTYSHVLFVNRRLQFVLKEIPDWLPIPLTAQHDGATYNLLTIELWQEIQAATERLEANYAAGQVDHEAYQRAGQRYVRLYEAIEKLGGGGGGVDGYGKGLAWLPRNLN